MRSRLLVPFGMLGIGVPILLFLIPRAFYAHVSKDYIGSFETWGPTPAEIAREVGPPAPGVSDEPRRAQFGRLFQQRYRSHEQAVGLHILGPHRMKLMFAALIPRWDMAHVAIAAYREAKHDLGASMDVDIYETYISMPQRKIGELRVRPSADGGPDQLAVVFDPRFAKEGLPKVTVRPSSPIPRFVLPCFYMDPATWPLLASMPQRMPSFPISGLVRAR